MLCDFHCHLDLYKDRAALFRRLEEFKGIVVAVTTTPRAYEANTRLFQRLPNVKVAVGLHPELAATTEADVSLFTRLVRSARYVGEIGIDGRPQNRATLTKQQEVLASLLDACNDGIARILSLHSAGAAQLIVEVLEQQSLGRQNVPILHWFTGSRALAERAASKGAYFSVNSAMLNSDRGRALVASLPPDRVLLETDGPFVEISGRPAAPPDITGLVALIALVWRTDAVEVEGILARNTAQVLSALK